MNESVKESLIRTTDQIRQACKPTAEILFHYLVQKFNPDACDYIPPYMVHKDGLKFWSKAQIRSALYQLAHLGLLEAKFGFLDEDDNMVELPKKVDVDFGVIGVEEIDLRTARLWTWEFPNQFANPVTGEWMPVQDIHEYYAATDLLKSFMQAHIDGNYRNCAVFDPDRLSDYAIPL